MNKSNLKFREICDKILTEAQKTNSLRNDYEGFDKEDIFGPEKEELLDKIKIINKNEDDFYGNEDISPEDYEKIISFVTDTLNNNNKVVDIDMFKDNEPSDTNGYVRVAKYQAPFEKYGTDYFMDYCCIDDYYFSRYYTLYYNKNNKEYPYKIEQEDLIALTTSDDKNISLSSVLVTNYFNSEMFNNIKARLGKRTEYK
jgi:hypothetical protein